MTRKTNLDIIRAACVAANPALDSRTIYDIYSDRDIYDDTTRLADVLFAIGVSKVSADLEFSLFEGRFKIQRKFQAIYWKLNNDFLTNQDEDTLSFLGGLLG